MTRILAGIIGAHVFDDYFITTSRAIDRDFPLNITDDCVTAVENPGKMISWTEEVPSDLKPGVGFTAKLDRCPGKRCLVCIGSRTYCGISCSTCAIQILYQKALRKAKRGGYWPHHVLTVHGMVAMVVYRLWQIRVQKRHSHFAVLLQGWPNKNAHLKNR